MKIYHTIKQLQDYLKSLKSQKIALVPTMGNLHQGHLSLVKIARSHADIVVVSIFVNPTQFGIGEDFDSYPRTLDADVAQLDGLVDVVFAPSVDEMYPTYPPNVQVLSGDISQILCAKTRPTHFDGVGLVVSKLFNIVRPDVAVFGKKDYQQLAIIRQLNDELNFGIDIIGGDIVRREDGLALSSRNGYLTDSQSRHAPFLQKTLSKLAKQLTIADFNDFDTLIKQAIDVLSGNQFRVDYLQVLNQKLQKPSKTDKNLVILTACFLGKTRLLDNVEFDRACQ
ncbi:pantoate--beta-alanine ligase [Moraxella nasovis]|uniref:pantoate--beta-alanine ligase n=1 Tax=Moraxella nasovis TaxID=2904121 RepID=UPI001F60CAF5|nr:pantoate--beta-alanine ligase [Moraxella nasovis]UNU72529.1 pantoate--beta-alanine ligase [Moraxella nasovis]